MKKFVIGTAAALMLAGCSAPEPTLIDLATEHVRGSLKDPKSAEFRGVYSFQLFDAQMICGEVNAKNSMGGYTGFAPFRTSRSADGIFESVDIHSDPKMAKMTVLGCGFLKNYAETHARPGEVATAADTAALSTAYGEFVQRAAHRVISGR